MQTTIQIKRWFQEFVEQNQSFIEGNKTASVRAREALAELKKHIEVRDDELKRELKEARKADRE